MGVLTLVVSAPLLFGGTRTILISFDGFRHDYVERLPDGVFKSMFSTGCRAQSLIPVNPTKTFPNHWSLATGLYPEHHGILDNRFYDRALVDTFAMSSTESVWWLGEPVWNTAERRGVMAYTYYWPGSNVAVQGMHPTRWFPYSGSRKYADRIDSVIAWSTMPQPPGLIVTYFELLDDAGHRHGPQSAQVDTALITAEALIARLVQGLRAHDVLDSVNIVIVSDHGMTATELPSPDQHRVQSALFGDSSLVVLVSHTNVFVYGLQPDQADAVAERVNADAALKIRATPSRRLDSSWHINHAARVPDLYAEALFGSTIDTGKRPLPQHGGGNHGYHNSNVDLHGIFVATGPDIKPGLLPSFSVVDVYNVICSLLRIQPALNDGNPEIARRVVRH